MQDNNNLPRIPRTRKYLKLFGKIALPLLFDLEITGKNNFPEDGPLIVVGNHEGAVDAVLMASFTPGNIEMLAGTEFPQEKIAEIARSLYGCIPVYRMFMDKKALEQSLAVLDKGGKVGVFPEGGVWDAGEMEPKPGAAWLSYYSRAPVIPIAFSGSKGAWHKVLNFKRPSLNMNIGEIIPPVEKVDENHKKQKLRNYSKMIWDRIDKLLPTSQKITSDHSFSLEITFRDNQGNNVKTPDNIKLKHKNKISILLFNTGIIKLLDFNLQIPTAVLKQIDQFHPAEKYHESITAILDYLEQENPYFLLYRLGIQTGLEIKAGLVELKKAAEWGMHNNLDIKLTSIHEYYLPEEKQKIIETAPEKFGKWI